MQKSHYTSRWVETNEERYKETTTWEEDHYGKKRIINKKILLQAFPDLAIGPGQFSFHFKFVLPTDLPASMADALGDSKARASVSYRLCAQFEPTDYSNWAYQ